MNLKPAAFVALLSALLAPALACAQQRIPLAELGAGEYRGWTGGLYPGGSNVPPPSHLATALELANGIHPRDATGALDPDGWIGMVSIGMSNTSQEFKILERLLDSASDVHPALRVVNGAQGGIAAETMADPAHPYWDLLAARVAAAGLSPAQVQVCWLKQALGTVADPTFPNHVLTLESHLAAIARNARQRFPNLRVCYLANRIYGGYTERIDRGEPLSYESGFAVQRVIARQIAGDADLNPDPAAGPVVAPLLLWGTEQWADGANPRQDGLAWVLEDYETDRIHPALAGETTAGQRWMAALRSELVAQHWLFRREPGEARVALAPTGDATVNATQPNANFGTMRDLRFGWPSGAAEATALLRFDASGLTIRGAKLGMANFNGIDVEWWPISGAAWSEATVTWNTRPALGPAALGAGPAWNGDGSTAIAIDPARPEFAGGHFGLALRRPNPEPVQRVHSRVSELPPLLVLRVADDGLFGNGFEPATGSVALAPADCAGLAGSPPTGLQVLPGMTCERGSVSTGGRTLDLALATLEPSGKQVGTILALGSGNGNQWFNAPELTGPLREAGFRVVQRRWLPGFRDFADPWSMRTDDAVPLALLLERLAERYEGPLCALGFSGGAMEVAEAMLHYGAAERLSMASLIGGPAYARMDERTLGGTAWDSRCAAAVAQHGLTTLDGSGACASLVSRYLADPGDVPSPAFGTFLAALVAGDPAAHAQLARLPILRAGAMTGLPGTRVDVVVGSHDPIPAIGGLDLLAALTGVTSRFTVVPNRRHWPLRDTANQPAFEPAGNLIIDGLAAGCRD
jgi:hypothetical protein